MTTSSNAGFSAYASSPADGSSNNGSQSSAPFLVDIGGNPSGYLSGYLTGGSLISQQQQQQQQSNAQVHLHHQQQQQQQQQQHHNGYLSPSSAAGMLYNPTIDQAMAAAANSASSIDSYIGAQSDNSGADQQSMQSNHQQLFASAHQALATASTPGSCQQTPAQMTTRSSHGGGKKRKHNGVDKKVYQATMKPIIERQRRARINSSLEELHTLLRLMTGSTLRSQGGPRSPSDGSSGCSSNNPRRIEKADILEQAVRFIKNLKSQPGNFNNGAMSSPGSNNSNSGSLQNSQPQRVQSPNSQPSGLQLAAIQQAFCAGYAECTRLTTSWLATHQDCDKMAHPGDESHLSHGGDNDSDSMVDDDDAFLGTDDDELESKASGLGQQLRAKLEDHLISRLNERLTAHLTKCLPPAASLTAASRTLLPPNMQQQMIPTPPQSPKDLLLPFSLGAACAAAAGNVNSVGPAGQAASNTAMYASQMTSQQSNMSQHQQFSPISPFSAAAAAAAAAQQQQQMPSSNGGASNGTIGAPSSSSTTVIYYDPSQPSTSNGATNIVPSSSMTSSSSSSSSGASSMPSTSSANLSPLMADFMDPKDPVALNNAMMFNSFVAQLQQTQRAAAAAGLYCWRPWD